MLDLKSKLAAAGLVTQKDIDRVDQSKGKAGTKKNRRGGGGHRSGESERGAPRLSVARLRDQNKGEQYDAVRRFIEKVRLDDPVRPPSEQAQPFHFPTAKGQIGRLVLEPEVIEGLKTGNAGLVAYMSNHGLAHVPVPAEAARAIAELFPLWLRVLNGHAGAGQREVSEAQTATPDAHATNASESAAESSMDGASH